MTSEKQDMMTDPLVYQDLGSSDSKNEASNRSSIKKYLALAAVAAAGMGIGATISSVATTNATINSTSEGSGLTAVSKYTTTIECTKDPGQCVCPGEGAIVCKSRNCDQSPYSYLPHGAVGCLDQYFRNNVETCYCGRTPTLESSAAFKSLSMPENAVKHDIEWYTIWTDSGSGADDDFGVFMPIAKGELQHTYFAIGMSSLRSHRKPTESQQLLLHKNTPLEIATSALSFSFVWNDSGSGANRDVSIIRPICPAGYGSVSDWAIDKHCKDEMTCTQGFTKYMEDRKWAPRPCVNLKLLTTCQSEHSVWTDRGSGASRDVSVKRFTHFGLQGTWLAQSNSIGLGYMRGNYGASTRECLIPEKVKAVQPSAVVDIVKGEWERVQSCTGCAKFIFELRRGTTKTRGTTEGISTTSSTQLSTSVALKAEAEFGIGESSTTVTTTLTTGLSKTINRAISSQMTKSLVEVRRYECDKRYLYQFVSTVTAQLFNAEDQFDNFFTYTEKLLCTDNPKPACPAFSCKTDQCDICCKDVAGNFEVCGQ